MREDVAIVGAGPAGAWAACRLARSGARVALVDPSHPREKACGGGVTGRALALVGDALAPDAFPRTIVRAARFTSVERRHTSTMADADGESATVALDDDALVVASRAAFDAALVDAAVRAGARLIRARVTDLTIDARRRTLRVATRKKSSSPAIRPAISGRFRGPIISRSASVHRPTPASAPRRCARERARGSTAPGSRRARRSRRTRGRSPRCRPAPTTRCRWPASGGRSSGTPPASSIRSREKGFFSRCAPPTRSRRRSPTAAARRPASSQSGTS